MSKVRERISELTTRFSESKFKTYLQWGVAGLVTVLFIGGWLGGWFEEEDVSVAEGEGMADLSQQYEIIKEVESGIGDRKGVNTTLLVKDPFISEDLFVSALKDYQVKKQEKMENEGKKFGALEIDIYTRRSNIDTMVDPMWTASYMHENGWMESINKSHWFYKGYKWDMSVYELNSDHKEKYLTEEEYKRFKDTLLIREVLDTDLRDAVSFRMKMEKGITLESDNYNEVKEEQLGIFRRAQDYGENFGLYDGMGEYLLDYLKEFEKEKYDSIMNQ